MNVYIYFIKMGLCAFLYLVISSLAYGHWNSSEEYKKRLGSFNAFPEDNISETVTRENMANACLVYSGTGDAVKCQSCDIKLNNWDQSDIPIQEHLKWHFIVKNKQMKVTCDFLREYMNVLKHREASFNVVNAFDSQVLWSNYKGEVKKLAQAGYYLIPGADSNKLPYLITHCCGLLIYPHREGHHIDDVVAYHKNSSPHCPHHRQTALPRYSHMQKAEARLRSMDNKNTMYSLWKWQLAKAGFFVDINNNSEFLCFQCGQRLENTDGDAVLTEHGRLNPQCPFLIENYKNDAIYSGISNLKEQSDALVYYERYPDNYDSKVNSFFEKSGGEYDSQYSSSISPEEAVKAGFRYEDNRLECTTCNLTLSGADQHEGMGIWSLHVKGSSDCGYVQTHLVTKEIKYLEVSELSYESEQAFFSNLSPYGEDGIPTIVDEHHVAFDSVDGVAAPERALVVSDECCHAKGATLSQAEEKFPRCRGCGTEPANVLLGCKDPASGPHRVCESCVRNIPNNFVWQCPICYQQPQKVRLSNGEMLQRKSDKGRE